MDSLAHKKTLFSINWQLILLVIVATLGYANTFNVPFIFDDIRNIVENQALRDLGNFLDLNHLASLSGEELSLHHTIKTRYIGYLSFALNYYFHDLSIWGYHFVNLCIHITNGFLVYALARVLLLPTNSNALLPIETEDVRSQRHFVPLLAALLFLSHPIQTQAITYVVQRLASLATMFTLSAFLFYLLARQVHDLNKNKTRLLVALSLTASALGALTKEFALFFPLYLLLWEGIFNSDSLRAKLRRLWPFACVSLLLIFIIFGQSLLNSGFSGINHMRAEATSASTLSSVEYFYTQMRVILTYLRLLLWPAEQNLDYDFPLYRSLLSPGVLGGVLVVTSLGTVACVLLRNARDAASEPRHILRLLAFLIWAFLLGLIPESSFFPIADVIFEHRLYAPSVWFFIFMALFIQYVLQRTCVNPKYRLYYSLVICCALVMSLVTATILRNRVWQDSLTLWRDVVAKSPQKPRPRANLAKALNAAGQYSLALNELQEGLKYAPRDLSLLQILGNTHRGLKQPDLAIQANLAALEVDPYDFVILSSLGELYNEISRYDLAVQNFSKAVALFPDRAKGHYNLGFVFKMQGQPQLAEKSYLQAIRLLPNYAEAHYNLAILYAEINQLDQAEIHYKRAIDSKPDLISAYNNLAVLLSNKKRPEEAIQWLARAQKIDPNNQSIRSNLILLNKQ